MRVKIYPFLFVLSLTWICSTSFAQSGNAILSKCADEGMTYDKKKCRDANAGKTFNFRGAVFDVKDATTITIRISNDNYADVVFLSNVGDTVKKDQVLSFHGRLSRIGTGIVVNHTIEDAILGEIRPQVKNKEKIAAENIKNLQECKTLYQGWVFNSLVELGCNFNGGIAEKALKMTRNICPNITEEQQSEWGKPVGAALDKDFKEFGIDGMCVRYKPRYDALAAEQ